MQNETKKNPLGPHQKKQLMLKLAKALEEHPPGGKEKNKKNQKPKFDKL